MSQYQRPTTGTKGISTNHVPIGFDRDNFRFSIAALKQVVFNHCFTVTVRRTMGVALCVFSANSTFEGTSFGILSRLQFLVGRCDRVVYAVTPNVLSLPSVESEEKRLYSFGHTVTS